MTRARILVAVLLIAGGGCSDDGSNGPPTTWPDCGPANDMAPAAPGTCSYDGTLYKTGDVFCATDGCNSCQCNPEGQSGVGCTQKACAAGGVVADVCKAPTPTVYPSCPRASNGDLPYKTGDTCPTTFATCIRSSAACAEYIRCECKNGLIDCHAFPPKDGETCLGIPGPASCFFSGGSDREICTCSAGTWSCKKEACPTDKPVEGSQCKSSPLLTCNYFAAKSACNYLDRFWHCSCTNGTYRCWDDKEDCQRDAGAPATDAGA